jgi:hypothetical protein
MAVRLVADWVHVEAAGMEMAEAVGKVLLEAEAGARGCILTEAVDTALTGVEDSILTGAVGIGHT